ETAQLDPLQVQLWAALAQGVGVMFMALATFFAWKAASATEMATRADLMFKLRGEYDTDQMLQDLDLLRAWYDRYGSGYEKMWIAAKNNNEDDLHRAAMELNSA